MWSSDSLICIFKFRIDEKRACMGRFMGFFLWCSRVVGSLGVGWWKVGGREGR